MSRLKHWPTGWLTGKVGDTPTALKAASPVVTLAPTLAEVEAETASKTLSDVEAQHWSTRFRPHYQR